MVAMISLFNRDMTGEGIHIDLAEAQCWTTFHIGQGAQPFLDENRIEPGADTGSSIKLSPMLLSL